MNILLDTNISLRMFEPTHAHYQLALDATDLLNLQEHDLYLVPQNYYEYWVVATRPLAQNGQGKTPDEVLVEFDTLDAQFRFLSDTDDVYREWRRLIAGHKPTGKPAHDARLVAAMQVHGLTHLLTFNVADFRRYPGIRAVDPAAVAAGSPLPP